MKKIIIIWSPYLRIGKLDDIFVFIYTKIVFKVYVKSNDKLTFHYIMEYEI